MNDWRKVTLQDVVSVLGDGIHGTPSYDENGEYYFINGNNLCNGKILIKDDTKKASIEEYKKYKKDLNDRTILVSINGTLGNVALYNNEKVFLGKSACYFNVFEEVDKQFIKYVVSGQSFRDYIDNFANGTTIKNVSLKTMREYPFLLPPISEQKSIASVLCNLDDKIDLLHRQNKTLEAMAETVFQEYFVERNDELLDETQLCDVVGISIGRTPPRKESKWFSNNPSDLKWISIKDMGTNGVYILQTAEYLTEEAVNTFNIPRIPENSVVLSFKMTVGRVAITSEEMLSNEAIAHFKFGANSAITKEYLYLFLKSYKYDTLGSTSSIVTAINSAMIKEIKIPIPGKSILSKFQKIAEPCFEKILSNQRQIITLVRLRDTLLPKLMSGQIRINL